MSALAQLIKSTRAAVEERKRSSDPAALVRAERQRLKRDPIRPFSQALKTPGLSLIAEHKRRSPSAGTIRDGIALEHVISSYESGGAAAFSILTEPTQFGGSLDDLRAARAVTRLPILRKDFVVDGFQLHESLAAGADAVLLIVAALSADDLRALHAEATSLGLDALVEVHAREELELASAAGATLIGINNRNLSTLAVNIRNTFALLPHVPPGAAVVAESGFRRPEQLQQLAAAGLDAVLIGEALMRSPDIEAACRELFSLI
jgi:indole-3-glycerol phosphate synthase